MRQLSFNFGGEAMKDGVTQALSIIKQFEGCRLTSYQDLVGVWTIGWGDTLGVQPQQVITQAEADARLESKVSELLAAIENMTHGAMLSENELGAVTSFAYNEGLSALVHSTLWLKVLNLDMAGAADEFLKWNKVRNPRTHMLEPCQGLTNRRTAERALFLKG